jgi:hypothetical protein
VVSAIGEQTGREPRVSPAATHGLVIVGTGTGATVARGLGRQINFAKARGRVPSGIGHQLHDQRVV